MNQQHFSKVNYSMFLRELTDELQAMSEYGTSYRYETAKLSLKVAQKVSDCNLFFDMKKTLQIVKFNLPSSTNSERIEDVSKMLNTILRSLQRSKSRTEETKKILAERSSSRKSVSLQLLK